MSKRGLSAEETKFYQETIEKENRQRLEWFLKHAGQRLLESAGPDTEPLVEQKGGGGRRNAVCEPAKPPAPVLVPVEPDEPINTDIMRPVPENVRKLLYTGVSAQGEGKHKYLIERYKERPKQKFYFMESGNWEYGWRVDGMDPALMESRRGRVNVIYESFYRRSGVGNDPSHYKQAINAKAPISLPLL